MYIYRCLLNVYITSLTVKDDKRSERFGDLLDAKI